MIKWKTGDIFNTSCKTIVNTVNCEGVMGKGLALECKKRYPAMFKVYQYACAYGKNGSLDHSILKDGGDLYFYWNHKANKDEDWLPFENELEKIHPNIFEVHDNHHILNFATKVFWRNPSKLEWIERGLQNFVKNYKIWNITSIAWPRLGCNNGKLNWETQVKPLMIKYLNDIDIINEIYE